MGMVFLFVGIIGCFACIGMFLWSYLEENPKKLWLLGAVIALAAGIVGFIVAG